MAALGLNLFANSDNFKKFPGTTIGIIVNQQKQDSPTNVIGSKEVTIDSRLIGYYSIVKYTGIYRPVSPEGMHILKGLLAIGIVDNHFASIFTEELKVTEDGTSYWILVQNNLINSLREELHKNENFKLFYRMAGIAFGQPQLIMIEFSSINENQEESFNKK